MIKKNKNLIIRRSRAIREKEEKTKDCHS